jgi:hypothetical protein
MRRILQCYRVHFLWAELGLSLALAILFALWSERWGGKSIIDTTLDGNRSAVYAALASIFGSLLGFVITAVSIVLGFSASEKLTVVRESKHYPTLWRVYIAAIRVLAFATIICVVALVLDRDKQIVHWVMYLAAFGCILATARVARCVWVLENIIALVSRPSQGKNT